MPTFSVHTLGCRANQSDSERLIEILSSAGFEQVEFGQKADCQIVNSCTVTRGADVKSAQLVRRAERLGGQVVVTGCGVAARGGLANRLPASVLKVTPQQQADLLGLLGVESCPTGQEFRESLGPRSNTRAQLRIQDGCEQFCTFCIVPYVRGRSRSQATADLIPKVQRLEAEGYAEIVLTGIHLSAWGQDLDAGEDLGDLLGALIASTKRVRFRLGSVEPDLFPRGIFALMRSHPTRLCPHLHLVLQHASDAVLKRMHRGYDLAHYEDLVSQLTITVEGACLTTDVMVGFPGESEADFRSLEAYLRKVPFYRIHVFPYSPRPGTAASKFSERVPEPVVEERRQRLLRLAERKRAAFIRSCLGQTRVVVLEGGQPRPGWLHATADNYLSVEVKGRPAWRGRMARVRFLRRLGDNAVGEIESFLDPTAQEPEPILNMPGLRSAPAGN
jgi:threonylcarbamoyladenosine tRNA methylthiotransferase MtaB